MSERTNMDINFYLKTMLKSLSAHRRAFLWFNLCMNWTDCKILFFYSGSFLYGLSTTAVKSRHFFQIQKSSLDGSPEP